MGKFLPGETSSTKTKQELQEVYQKVAQAEARPLPFDTRFCWVTKIFSASGIWDRRRCQIVSLPEYSSAIGAERTQKQKQAGVLEQKQPVILCIKAYGASQAIIASHLLNQYMCHQLVRYSLHSSYLRLKVQYHCLAHDGTSCGDACPCSATRLCIHADMLLNLLVRHKGLMCVSYRNVCMLRDSSLSNLLCFCALSA